MFAIQQVNLDPTLLGDLRLGAHIVDSCSSDMHALRQSLAFVRSHFVALERESDFICGDYSTPQRRHDDPSEWWPRQRIRMVVLRQARHKLSFRGVPPPGCGTSDFCPIFRQKYPSNPKS